MFLSRKCHRPNRRTWPVLASMGPGCFYPGNRASSASMERLVLASMGPGCFYPGNAPRISHPRPRSACFNGAGMFLSRKWVLCVVGEATAGALQWGRDVSIPEMTKSGASDADIHSFNGAGMFLSRKSEYGQGFGVRLLASMGPGCFYPGNTVAIGAAGTAGGLQWGRDVSIPEMIIVQPSGQTNSRFNGAGMFLSRKWLA